MALLNTVFSLVSFKSAYHQVLLKDLDRKYTAFEANEALFQFCKILFQITNRALAF